MSYALGVVGGYAPLLGERLLDVVVFDALHVYALHAAANGLEQLVGLVAHEQEHRLHGRFLEQLQYLVGADHVHAFGQPDDDHLVAALARLEAQLAYQCLALCLKYHRLLVGHLDALQPAVHGEVGARQEHVAPFPHKVVAHHLGLAGGAGGLDDGEAEVQVGVLPLLEHGAFAQQIGGQRQRHSHLAAAVGAAEHERVGHPVLLCHLHETLLGLLLSYYLVKCHISRLVTSATLSTADTV